MLRVSMFFHLASTEVFPALDSKHIENEHVIFTSVTVVLLAKVIKIMATSIGISLLG